MVVAKATARVVARMAAEARARAEAAAEATATVAAVAVVEAVAMGGKKHHTRTTVARTRLSTHPLQNCNRWASCDCEQRRKTPGTGVRNKGAVCVCGQGVPEFKGGHEPIVQQIVCAALAVALANAARAEDGRLLLRVAVLCVIVVACVGVDVFLAHGRGIGRRDGFETDSTLAAIVAVVRRTHLWRRRRGRWRWRRRRRCRWAWGHTRRRTGRRRDKRRWR